MGDGMKGKAPRDVQLSKAARFRMDGPGDLLAKLEHDIKRITAAPKRAVAAYATIDAAITAWSITDWCHEALLARDSRTKKAEVKRAMKRLVPGLEACRMIANAAKHFVVDDYPIDVDGNIISMGSRSVDPTTGKVVKSRSELALIYWNGQSSPADEFMTVVQRGIDGYLRANDLDRRCTYLNAIFDSED
jgi:hypothetical protein